MPKKLWSSKRFVHNPISAINAKQWSEEVTDKLTDYNF